ncbi:MAG: hypothetical protein RL547_1952 [Actinomycetota bacterium]
MGRHPGERDLIRPQTQDSPRDAVGVARHETIDDGVARTAHTCRPVHEFGHETPVDRFEFRRGEQTREDQIGVGAVVLDSSECVERDLARGPDRHVEKCTGAPRRPFTQSRAFIMARPSG